MQFSKAKTISYTLLIFLMLFSFMWIIEPLTHLKPVKGEIVQVVQITEEKTSLWFPTVGEAKTPLQRSISTEVTYGVDVLVHNFYVYCELSPERYEPLAGSDHVLLYYEEMDNGEFFCKDLQPRETDK